MTITVDAAPKHPRLSPADARSIAHVATLIREQVRAAAQCIGASVAEPEAIESDQDLMLAWFMPGRLATVTIRPSQGERFHAVIVHHRALCYLFAYPAIDAPAGDYVTMWPEFLIDFARPE